MKKSKKDGSFILVLVLNLILNLEWIIPAVILLVLHFLFDWPIWLFWAALGLWVGIIVIEMLVLRWAAGCGNAPEPEKKNLNPYSSTINSKKGESGIKKD